MRIVLVSAMNGGKPVVVGPVEGLSNLMSGKERMTYQQRAQEWSGIPVVFQ